VSNLTQFAFFIKHQLELYFTSDPVQGILFVKDQYKSKGKTPAPTHIFPSEAIWQSWGSQLPEDHHHRIGTAENEVTNLVVKKRL
jgi:hypothetical protein